MTELTRGARAVLPLALAAIPFAMILGALAREAGLTPLEVALMGALVFAGASQVMAVELWAEPAPWLLITVLTLLVNARHVLMGAVLVPRLAPAPWRREAAGLALLTDETFGLTLGAIRAGPTGVGYLAGSGLVLWLAWVSATTAGAALGVLVEDPASWGLDLVFTAVFIVILRGLWRGRPTLLPWLASAAVAIAASRLSDGPWYVPLGATAGFATAYLAGRPATAR